MKMSFAEYRKSKETTCLGRWCLLHGPEQHLKREALARIHKEADRAAGRGEEATWEVLDGRSASLQDILARSQTVALFGGARVVVVREAEQLDEKEQNELAERVPHGLPPKVSVVLVTGESGGRRRGKSMRAPLRRAIEEEGIAVDCRPLKVREATAWAVREAKRRGKKLEPAAARKLVEQKVGTGLAEIESEVEKLSLYVGDLEIISAGHVDEVTPRRLEEDVFRLADAVGARDAARAALILRQLLGERAESPHRILWQLAHTVRLIWQTKLLLERGWRPGGKAEEETAALLPQERRKNALQEFGRKSWLVKRTMPQAKALSWEELARAMHALSACDMAMKGIGGKVDDEAVALELLVVQLCTGQEMPVWESAKPKRVRST